MQKMIENTIEAKKQLCWEQLTDSLRAGEITDIEMMELYNEKCDDLYNSYQ